MNRIHITLTAKDIRENELAGHAAVVIDVLRATSVMITALANGARWVKPVATVEEAHEMRSPEVVTGGERHALPVEGFDFSNSPLAYTREKVSGKGLVLSTTNGTLALSKCNQASEVLIGAFLNHQAVSKYLIDRNLPVELICAGTNGEFSLDDFLCAGLICTELMASGLFDTDDLGRLAMNSWNQAEPNLHAALFHATHYNVLKSKGFDKDLIYCLNPGAQPVLVVRNPDNRYQLADETKV